MDLVTGVNIKSESFPQLKKTLAS